MGLIDGANGLIRRLNKPHRFESVPSGLRWFCGSCPAVMPERGEMASDDEIVALLPHADYCPRVVLPRIVRALEAAQRLSNLLGDRFPSEIEEQAGDAYAIAWACCGGSAFSSHMAHCPWMKLREALRDDL